MLKHFVSFLAVSSLMLVSAASPSIGFVKSTGEFRVDGSAVRGNGTLFEGNLIETTAARSVIQLAGAQITLAPGSRARVYRDRLVLEKGSGVTKDSTRHIIEAGSMRIAPLARDSVVQFEIAGPSRVIVASSGGPAEVRNSSGILTASLAPGMSLAFEPQAATVTAVKMTGVIILRNGAYFLTDETTKVTVQVEGSDVARNVGRRVEITGSSITGASPAAGAGASQIVRATTVRPLGNAGAGGAGAGGGAAGAGSAGGMSGAAIGAIVGGVAVGGTLIGLAAAGTFSNDEPVSRQ